MKKTLSTVLAFILTASVVFIFASCSSGNSGEDLDDTDRLYLFDEETFRTFESEIYKDGPKKSFSDAYVKNPKVGTEYYLVAYTAAETDDGSGLEFSNGKIQIEAQDADGKFLNIGDIVDTLSMNADNSAMIREDSSDTAYFRNSFIVDYSTYRSSAKFYTYIKFVIKQEATLVFKYNISHTLSKDNFNSGCSISSSWIKASYENSIEVDSFKMRYLMDEDYVDGKYDENDLISPVNMDNLKVGEIYYMVISAMIASDDEEIRNEPFTFSLRLSSVNSITGTLEYASSGNFDQLISENEKIISTSFKIPDSGAKEITFIVKLTPTQTGMMRAKFEFSAEKIAVVGNNARRTYELRIEQ